MQWNFKGNWLAAALFVVGPTRLLNRSGEKRGLRRYLRLLCGAVCAPVVVDPSAPGRCDLRRFDPLEMARLETLMWRAYYERKRLRLFTQLTELLRAQYGLPWLRANLVAYQAARAAFVFKRGHDRAAYERALPHLEKFYASLRRMNNTRFNPRRAARLELEWWIVHRERACHGANDLVGVLAALAAEVYRAPVESMLEHGRLRAEAMTIRDTRAARGALNANHWARINELLRQSWTSLSRAVNE